VSSTAARHRKTRSAPARPSAAPRPGEAPAPKAAPALNGASHRSAVPAPGVLPASNGASHRSAAPPSPASRPGDAAPRRMLSAIASVLLTRPGRITITTLVSMVFLVSFWPGAAHWLAQATSPVWVDEADALGLQLAARLGEQAHMAPKVIRVGVAVAPVYLDPFRSVAGLVPERIDQGVDFNGSGPVYALGDAVVTNADRDNTGWPGGGWITYQLTYGPDAGLTVFVAEDVTPNVQVGQQVTPDTVIGYMFGGFDGIETGWAQPGGLSAESQLPAAGGIGGFGPFPTKVGLNFDLLLESLGVPAAPNAAQPAYGLLPVGYPASYQPND
jgi:hypothetical protein